MPEHVTLTVPVAKVLAALLGDPHGDHYGLELIKATSLPSGTLYPILLRLEQDGLVTSAWHAGEAGPGRKIFQITTHGRTELQRRHASWNAFTAAADSLLSGASPVRDEGNP